MVHLYYYAILFFVSLFSTWWIFKKVLRIAIEKNIVDNPDARKLQRVPVPVLGGVAFFFGIVVALTISDIMFSPTPLFSIIGVLVIMLYIGTVDDVISLSPYTRFVAEIGVVLILIYGKGVSLNSFHGLWGVEAIPEWFAVPLTIFACVGIINAINLIDGVNGLSSGYCVMACSIFAFVFLWAGDRHAASLAILSVGALLPFFCHNVFGVRSKMFMGDGGTLLMGTIMSILVLDALSDNSFLSQKADADFGLVAFVLAVLAVPVFDTLRVMFTRIFRGVSPFRPDKTHLHHLLLDLHFSHIGASVIEVGANLTIVGLWFLSYILGASVDLQLYIVIALGILFTFGFYVFARTQDKKQTKIYSMMIWFGDHTHLVNKRWVKKFTKYLDR